METNIDFEINQIDNELAHALTDFAPLKLKPSKLIQTTIKLEHIYGSIENIPNSYLKRLNKLSRSDEIMANRGIKYYYSRHVSIRRTAHLMGCSNGYVRNRFERLKQSTNQ